MFDAKAQYLSSLENLGVDPCDPRNIDEIILAKKELNSKLKFQYLEQETKEKFMRLIIENKPIYIDQKDSNEIAEENVKLKSGLKAVKQENDSLILELIQMSEQISGQVDAMSTLERENLDLNNKISQLTSQIDQVTREIDLKEAEFNVDPSDEIILKLDSVEVEDKIRIANSVNDLKNLIDIKSQEAVSLQDQIAHTNSELLRVELEISQNGSKIIGLENNKRELVVKLQKSIELRDSQLSDNEVSSDLVKLEKLGKDLSKLISIWRNLTTLDIQITLETDDQLSVTIDKAVLTVRYYNDNRLRCFKILEIKGISVPVFCIDKCNYQDDCIAYFINEFVLK